MEAIEEQTNSIGQPRRVRRIKRRSVARSRRQPGNDLLWNVLSVIAWLATACVVMAVATIITNPQSLPEIIRPVPPVPPTLVSAVQIPTITPTLFPSFTPKTSEPTVTRTVTPTPVTPTATLTPTPTATDTVTPGPSPTPTIHSLYPFILRGEIKVIPGATFPDHDSCRLWVAGQAYDLQGAPMQGITVMLGGYMDGKNLYQLSLTGTALQYGQAGYEFTVADKAVKSRQSVRVALFDQAMIPLSGKIYFDTYEDCSQNLILINFRQIR